MNLTAMRLIQYKLKVDGIYYICCNGKIRKGVLTHTTSRGFNFIDYFTNKRLFKKHLYPIERERDKAKELTFIMPMNIIVEKISRKNVSTKLLDKFILETTNKVRTDVLYDWIKEGTINPEQFNELLHLI
jgi:hypothetical protein